MKKFVLLLLPFIFLSCSQTDPTIKPEHELPKNLVPDEFLGTYQAMKEPKLKIILEPNKITIEEPTQLFIITEGTRGGWEKSRYFGVFFKNEGEISVELLPSYRIKVIYRKQNLGEYTQNAYEKLP